MPAAAKTASKRPARAEGSELGDGVSKVKRQHKQMVAATVWTGPQKMNDELTLETLFNKIVTNAAISRPVACDVVTMFHRSFTPMATVLRHIKKNGVKVSLHEVATLVADPAGASMTLCSGSAHAYGSLAEVSDSFEAGAHCLRHGKQCVSEWTNGRVRVCIGDAKEHTSKQIALVVANMHIDVGVFFSSPGDLASELRSRLSETHAVSEIIVSNASTGLPLDGKTKMTFIYSKNYSDPVKRVEKCLVQEYISPRYLAVQNISNAVSEGWCALISERMPTSVDATQKDHVATSLNGLCDGEGRSMVQAEIESIGMPEVLNLGVAGKQGCGAVSRACILRQWMLSKRLRVGFVGIDGPIQTSIDGIIGMPLGTKKLIMGYVGKHATEVNSDTLKFEMVTFPTMLSLLGFHVDGHNVALACAKAVGGALANATPATSIEIAVVSMVSVVANSAMSGASTPAPSAP